MEEKMEFDLFCEELESAVRELFPDEFSVEIHRVIKNNSLILDSLVILDGKNSVSPNFYLQTYYKDYLGGETIDDLAEKIREQYEYTFAENQKLDFDLSFDWCKSRLVFRLVSYEKNQEILQSVPYFRFLDMAVIFYLLVKKSEDAIGSVRVNQEMADRWNLDVSQLFRLAKKNTQKIFPAKICSMSQLLETMLSEEMNGQESNFFQKGVYHTKMVKEPYIITNESNTNGAAAILYADTLRQMGEIFQSDFYLLPSSIHEMLTLSARVATSPKELRDMVGDVNSTCVAEDEVLSDEVYYYERKTNTIKICRDRVDYNYNYNV